jgi:hypothetical protein
MCDDVQAGRPIRMRFRENLELQGGEAPATATTATPTQDDD